MSSLHAALSVLASCAVGALVANGRSQIALIPVLGLVLLLASPRMLISGAIFSFGFVPIVGGSAQAVSVGLVAVIGIAVVRSGRLVWSPPGMPVLVLVAYLLASAFWGSAGLRSGFFALLPTAVLVLGCVRWPTSTEMLLRSLSGAAVVHAAATIVVFVTGSGERVTQIGAYALPQMVVGAVAADWLARHGKLSNRRLQRSIFFLSVGGVVLTQTRGMILGLLAGVLASRLRDSSDVFARRVVRGVAATAVLAVVLGLSLQNLGGRLSLHALSVGLEGRTVDAKVGLSEWSSSPIFGHGVGHTFVNPTSGTNQIVNYVHNVFIYFAVIGGILGVSLLVWVLYRGLFRRGWRLRDGTGAVGVALCTYAMTAALQRTMAFNLFLAAVFAHADSKVEH